MQKPCSYGRSWRAALASVLLAMLIPTAMASSLPSGFSEQPVNRPDGLAWDGAGGVVASDGRLFVWERSGRVWVVGAGTAQTPLIDLSDEVSTIGSLGMTGFALDPQFEQNGYVYAFFTVEPQHLTNCEAPPQGAPACRGSYRPGQHATAGASIARLVRYQLSAAAGAKDFGSATHVNYARRRVLIGENPTHGGAPSGCIVTGTAQGSGAIAFANDGTLLASCGDGASSTGEDAGSDAETQFAQALALGLMTPAENVGAFRAQLVDSLSGKILRIDPATGNGVQSNPFYDSSAPRAARSRVWILGLHDPEHFAVRPGSGSSTAAQGRPGTLYIGDVGLFSWESLAVARTGRMNFGWPLYEGIGDEPTGFAGLSASNLEARNPLSRSGCAQPYFQFRDLITAESAKGPSWPNPCQPASEIPPGDDVFVRDRPMIDWLHGGTDARWAAFDLSGEPLALLLGTRAPTGAYVSGPLFGGSRSVGGAWYEGLEFPAALRDTYFHADSGGEWIKAFTFDGNDNPLAVRDFLASGGPISALATDPKGGALYYVTGMAGSQVRKLSYVGSSAATTPAVTTPAAAAPAPTTPAATPTAPAPMHAPQPAPAVGAASLSRTAATSAPSHKAAIAVTAPSPQGASPSPSWTGADVGAVTAVGSYTLNNGTFTVQGSGADIWAKADAFQFVSEALTGDGSITAHVASQTNTNAWAKAGVMIRESEAAGSTYAAVEVTPAEGIALQARTVTGINAVTTQGPFLKAPYWVRVVRAGNTFTGYRSPDGITWSTIGQYSINMAAEVYVGLAVSSHANGVLSTAVFDNVTVSSAGTTDTQAPTVPSGLATSAVTASSVTLSWNASTDLPNPGGTGVGGYYVYRNGNTTPLATVTSGTTYIDAGLTPATAYAYRVAAFDRAAPPNVSAPSAAINVTTQNGQPNSWSSTDIGAVAAAGSYTLNGSTFTVQGSGADIWGTADAFQFVSQALVGDGSITAHVVSQTNTNGWAKTGVMIRETLAAGSAYAAAEVTPADGIALQARTATGLNAVSTQGPFLKAPYWLRVVRSGNTFTGYRSPDGASWSAIGQYSIPMAAQVYVGLAVSSHANGVLSTAVFDNVTVSSAGSVTDTQAPTVPTGLAASAVTSSSVTLNWNASTDLPNPGGTGVGGYFVYRGGNTTTPLASVTSGTSYTDSGLAAATAYSYQVAAFDRAAPPNVSAPSAAINATTQSVQTGNWSSGDIGAVGIAGSYTLSGGTFTVEGSGADIWGTADEFQFVSEALIGDGSITAHVTSQTDTNAWAKAGVMIRQSLAAGSAYAAVELTPANGAVFQARTATGISAVTTQGPFDKAPYWVRVTRSGTKFTGYVSSDGMTWSAIGQYSITMGTQVYVGLAVDSHSNGALSTVVFDNVQVPSSSSTAVALTPRNASLTLSQSQQFTASTLAGSTINWSVDSIAGGNASVGSISSTGVYVPPSSPGTHSITATNASDPTSFATATVAVTDLQNVSTYHMDLARTGQNLHEYALTPGSVSSGDFAKLWSCPLDGAAYAQPLYVANLPIGGGVHNVLFVATQHDSVYAFDADSPDCVTYWRVSFLGTGVTTIPASDNGCSDILLEYGITGTPVIDPLSRTLYVVAATKESGTYFQRLHALNILTGGERAASPVVIQGSVTNASGAKITYSALQQNQRPGLVLSGGGVYIGWSSHCDNTPWWGWLMRYDASSLAQTAIFNTTPDGNAGGIWMSGGAPAVDATGSIFFATGNGTFDDTGDVIPPVAPKNDFGESFVKLDPLTLSVVDFYTPSQEALWSNEDLDIASSGVTVLPDGAGPATHPNVLIGSDKQGHLWMIDRMQMQRFSSSSDNVVQHLTSAANCAQECVFATPGYWNGTLYLGSSWGRLMAFPLAGGLIAQTAKGVAAPASQSQESYQFPGPTPTISASPAGAAIVWTLDNRSNLTGPAILRAYDATNLGTTLYSSASFATDAAGTALKFTVPVVANGHVYVGGAVQLTVYGLVP